MIDLYNIISDKTVEEIQNNKTYTVIFILNEMSWWSCPGDPNDMPDMNKRREYFNTINEYALKNNVNISCNELLNPDYTNWIEFLSYLINKLECLLISDLDH